MPTLFLRAVFSKFFGRRCLVEGLVSAPAHPLPAPKNVSTPGLKKWQDSQIHILASFSAVLPLKVGIFIVNMPPLLSRVLDVLGGILKKGKSSEFNS